MSNHTPTTEPSRIEKIMDTLAYYQCRETNPKADHPTMGYHAFSDGQRNFLQEKKREAAEEVERIIAAEIRKAKAQTWEEGYGDCYTFHMSHGLQGTDTNPYEEES